MSTDRTAELLPLKPQWFHILLALQQEDQHGFAIRNAVERRTGGRVRLWPATLYGAIRHLTEHGLIVALEGADDPDDDQRRQYYRITARGKDVLRAEADRLQRLVDAVRTGRTAT